MSRIRSVKPEFWTSQKVARVPRDARLVFIGLWNEADDEGRLVDSPKRLAGALFPFDDDADAAWLDDRMYQLEEVGLIVRYEIDGRRYAAIPSFKEHQHPDKPRKSLIPQPSDAVANAPRLLPEASPTPPRLLPEASTGDRDRDQEKDRERDTAPAAVALTEKVIPRSPKTPRNQTIVGMIEVEGMPKTPSDILKDPHYGPEFRRKFPALDGEGPRPTIAGEITALMPDFHRNYREKGRDVAFNKLLGWIASRYGPHEISWKRSGGVDVDAVANGRRGA